MYCLDSGNDLRDRMQVDLFVIDLMFVVQKCSKANQKLSNKLKLRRVFVDFCVTLCQKNI